MVGTIAVGHFRLGLSEMEEKEASEYVVLGRTAGLLDRIGVETPPGLVLWLRLVFWLGSGTRSLQGLVRAVLNNVDPAVFRTPMRSKKHAVFLRSTIVRLRKRSASLA